MQPLRRSAFGARMCFFLGMILALGLGTSDFETVGGTVAYNTPAAVALMEICLLLMLTASGQRTIDFGAPAFGRSLLAIGSVIFFPFVKLALLFVPSAVSGDRANTRSGKATGPVVRVLISLPMGVVCGLAMLLLTRAMSSVL